MATVSVSVIRFMCLHEGLLQSFYFMHVAFEAFALVTACWLCTLLELPSVVTPHARCMWHFFSHAVEFALRSCVLNLLFLNPSIGVYGLSFWSYEHARWYLLLGTWPVVVAVMLLVRFGVWLFTSSTPRRGERSMAWTAVLSTLWIDSVWVTQTQWTAATVLSAVEGVGVLIAYCVAVGLSSISLPWVIIGALLCILRVALHWRMKELFYPGNRSKSVEFQMTTEVTNPLGSGSGSGSGLASASAYSAPSGMQFAGLGNLIR
jgi:hypothetical protein